MRVLDVAAGGAWFRLDGEGVDLAERPVLARLLDGLAAAPPDQAQPAAEVCAWTWPGERADPQSMRRRLHFAVSELRRLGLRDVLVFERGGYRLAAQVRRPDAAASDVQPPLDTFVGRAAELEAIAAALGDGARIVSLLGPGGVGKSRLARQFAAGWARDGGSVRWVELAGAPVGGAVAAAFGVEDPLAAFGRAPLLLVLDEAELQIDEVAAWVVAALGRAPGLRCLVTSRLPLEIAGERRIAVPPLSDADAVQLLALRAGALGAAVDGDPAPLIVLLDGLPLAIELAAVRLQAVPVPGLIAWIEADGPDALSGARRDAPEHHRSVTRLIDRSWALEAPPIREAWARLAVARAPFDDRAAAALLGWPLPRVLDALHHLVAHHLLTPIRTSSPTDAPRWRYRMADTLRRYGRVRLAELGLVEETEARHRRHFAGDGPPAQRRWEEADTWAAYAGARAAGELDLAARCLIRLYPGPGVLEACADARRADGLDPELALTLELLLGVATVHRGDPAVGEVQMRALLGRPEVRASPAMLGRIHRALASLASGRGDLGAALAELEASARHLRAADRPEDEARTLADRALALAVSDPHAACDELQRALMRLGALGGPFRAATIRTNLGYLLVQVGRYADAEAVLERALSDACGEDPEDEGVALRGLAELRAQLGRLDEAWDAAQRALVLHPAGAVRPATRAFSLIQAARTARDRGAPELAEPLLHEALACCAGRSVRIERGVRLLLAVVLADLGRMEAADEQLAAAGPIAGAGIEGAAAHWAFAAVALRGGRVEEAARHLGGAGRLVRALRLPAHAPMPRQLASLERGLRSAQGVGLPGEA